MSVSLRFEQVRGDLLPFAMILSTALTMAVPPTESGGCRRCPCRKAPLPVAAHLDLSTGMPSLAPPPARTWSRGLAVAVEPVKTVTVPVGARTLAGFEQAGARAERTGDGRRHAAGLVM